MPIPSFQPLPTVSPTSPTALASSVQGEGRGAILLGIVLLFNVWIFSIPPSFRRAYICSSPACEEQRCNDCVTLTEWTDGIKDYYQNGGGIQFDFTVAQETKDLWSGNKK